jgi:MerR family copper efflux transcriptional regulator
VSDAKVFNIGLASKSSGISSKMIRHYEEVGLLGTAKRSHSGYRIYNENDLHVLNFIRHARDLGFSIKKIQELLGLWLNKDRASEQVKKIAMEHIVELDNKIQSLLSMKEELLALAKRCHGNARPDCPIIEKLAHH